MGGIGSGRPSVVTKTVESTRYIDIRYMRRHGLLVNGTTGSLQWLSGDVYKGSINYCVEAGTLVLSFRFCRHTVDSVWRDAEQHILLSDTPCHFGGTRQWFHCPRCHRRCAVLYGADLLFLCRKCYRLPYQTQLENEHGRACIKRNKLRAKMYSDKRMWRRTREQLMKDYLQAVDRADLTLIECMERVVAV